MTLNTGIFDVSDPQNPDRVYSATLLSRILSKHIRDGVVHGDGNEMAVTVTDPPAMSVQVGTGTAMIRGRFCESDAALTLPVTTAHATYPRIDRVVVRLNASPGRTIDIVVKPGTAAPEPAAPALTRTAETWELSLAQVRVEAGATSIVAGKITDERGNASLCGVAAPVYVPSSQLEVVGAVNMQSNALTGLPVPSASTDAARKGYVDTEIAGAIGGFGISQIAIDAPKDWGNQEITNLRILGTSNLWRRATPSDTVVTASNGTETTNSTSPVLCKEIVVGPRNVPSATYRVKFDHSSAGNVTTHGAIYINGVQRGTTHTAVNSTPSVISEDFVLNPRDRVQLYLWSGNASWTSVSTYLQLCASFTSITLTDSPENAVTL